jgi:hypothetical protein
MNILDSFGVDVSTLVDQQGKHDPTVVQGRVAHIDADFMAYIIAADTRAELEGDKPMRTLQYKYGQITDFAEYIKRKAGASDYVLHVTPSGTTKGGRPAQAVQKEYQANRAGTEPPEHLVVLRQYMVTECKAVGHMDQEADDGMCQANHADPKNSIICSADKDLRMVPGLHLDMDTGEIVDVPFNNYGSIWIDASKSAKKLVGYGPAFFFAQCLMGDTADNIKGLPSVPARAAMKAKPTQTFLKDVERYKAAKTDITKALALDRVNSHLVLPKQCGAVTAHNLLKDITTVRDAFHFVRKLFTDLAEQHEHKYEHWQTTKEVTPTAALFGDMQLLWMRRNKNPNDVLMFLKDNN